MSELETPGVVELIRYEGLDHEQMRHAYEENVEHWASILRAQEAGPRADEEDVQAFCDRLTLEDWERRDRPTRLELHAERIIRWQDRRERVLGGGFTTLSGLGSEEQPALMQGQLVAVMDHQQIRFPNFQFACPEVRQRVAEVGRALGIPAPNWVAAEWWFTPNAFLKDVRPADAVNDAPLTEKLVQALLRTRPEPNEVLDTGLY